MEPNATNCRKTYNGTPRLLTWAYLGLTVFFLGWGPGGCGGGGDAAPPPSTSNPGVGGEPATSSASLKTVVVASGLSYPWGMTFLPDGTMLVAQKTGQMKIITTQGVTQATVTGLPAVDSVGQGGLLDVQLDPDYATTQWVYWSYAEPGTGSEAGLTGTAVARGKIIGGTMTQIEVLFRQSPKTLGEGHFGSRLAFARDKTLFVTMGERQKDDPANPGLGNAQNLTNHLGKIVRINRDGSIPNNNPNFGTSGAQPEIYSYGHRNVQGAAIHPLTGDLWVSEHGPQGGDEINLILPGRNYGWPLRSYGCPYGAPIGDACRVGGGTHAPDFEEPLTYWAPISTAPSGMTFYTGTRYPGWAGNLFVGSLAGESLWRLTLNGNHVTDKEALLTNTIGRIRHVVQGPDGWLYLLTDDGFIYRLETT
ncbi:MAG: PQQ-dependent sugar dehydrogenase [Aquabacterium sp.]